MVTPLLGGEFDILSPELDILSPELNSKFASPLHSLPMTRLARIVVPGLPHHVTQRGSRRQRTFFSDADYRAYLALVGDWCARAEVAIWAWCLMPNHVHLIVVPAGADGLRRAFGEAHRRYGRMVNAREGWTGHFWQARFGSSALDEAHLLQAVRYVELNPVRAHLVPGAANWPWSSARAHLGLAADGLLDDAPLRAMIPDWRAYLDAGLDEPAAEALRLHGRTGRPLGGEVFLARLEATLGRPVRPGKPGPKP